MLNKLKKNLPAPIKTKLKQIILNLELIFIAVFAQFGFTASLYYCLFSRSFYREHKAVLQARLAYYRGLKQPVNTSALLRRNIHRIEKGLIMQPKKEVFAEAYITETVKCYKAALIAPHFCYSELKWATDVLQNYFAVVANTPLITSAKIQFLQLQKNELNPELNPSVPYLHSMLPKSLVSYEQLYNLLQRRRSVRWYKPRLVDPALIRAAIQAAAFAPSACNRQPFQFYIANNSSKATQIAQCAEGTKGFADNIPCVIAIVGDLSSYPHERDRHIIYIDGALASMQLMLALETLGLQSCPLNWPDIEHNERKLAALLKLPTYLRPIMLLAVGYAREDGGIPFSQKKNADLLIKEVL